MSDSVWTYHHDEPLTRYSLGVDGPRPLVCFGVNPSTAVPNDLDPTLASVERFAKSCGYEGWLMFNLYPQRATNPDKMHKHFNRKIHQRNVEVIADLLQGRSPDIWCAWGTLIEKRSYLQRCLADIYEVLENNKCSYYRIGKISKAGHPHHPLYLRKTEEPKPFDLHSYMDLLST
ncbi:DUF1643 domain-containing protein [Balneola sp. MJW-20]|uniref:DUF1643 domain-containing protein n=1 Tax=Gracilimonas aurantiaca TaxID=3234185 RepID=UPI003464F0A5